MFDEVSECREWEKEDRVGYQVPTLENFTCCATTKEKEVEWRRQASKQLSVMPVVIKYSSVVTGLCIQVVCLFVCLSRFIFCVSFVGFHIFVFYFLSITAGGG